jgi:hypothetical protein
MKRMNKYRSSVHKVRTLHDLELEKAKMEMELFKSEETIKSSYRQLLQRLTFRNLAGTLVDEVSTGTLARAISIGKSFLEKRKKKKREKALKQEMVAPSDENTVNQ